MRMILQRISLPQKSEILTFLLIFGSLIIYFFATIPFTNKPFITDELELVLLGKGIIFNGLPYFYMGINYPPEPHTHPLLSMYIIASFLKLFYGADFSVRLVGVFCYLGNLVLIYLISKEIQDKISPLIGAVSIFLFSINPAVIQGSLLLAHDTMILSFLMTLFLLFFIKFGIKKSSLKNDILLGVLFGVLLWEKFHSLLLLPPIFLYHLLNKDFKKAIFQPLIIFSVGSCLFLITWSLYCRLYSYPFSTPFTHNLRYLSGLSSQWLKGLFTQLFILRNIIGWTSPFFVILILFSLVAAIKRYTKYKMITQNDLLIIYGFGIFITYILTKIPSAGFIYYHYPMLPTFSIVISAFIIQYLKFTTKEVVLCTGLVLMSIIYCTLVVGDPLLFPFVPKSALFTDPVKLKILITKSLLPVFFYLILFFVVIAVIKITKRDYSISKTLIVGSFLLLISANIGFDLVQKKADYSMTYYYGEKGFIETAGYLKKLIKPNELVLTQYDIAYASNIYLFIEMGRLPCWTGNDPTIFEQTLTNHPFKWIVVRKSFYDQVGYNPIPILNARFKLVKNFGNFDIYRQK